MRKETIDITYQTEIMTAIKNNSELVFITYSDLENTEEKIKFALAKILEKFKRDEILTPIRSCIKELIANSPSRSLILEVCLCLKYAFGQHNL